MNHTDILIQIRQIIRSVNLESKRIEKEYGISIPQLLCLNYLYQKEDFQASHKEIKNFLKLNASTVTGIIARLERKGLIARLPHRKDKRIVAISITAKGSELIDSTPEPLHHQLSKKLKELSPESLQKLQESFETIIDFLNIDEVDASPIITGETNIPRRDEEPDL